MTRPNPVQHDLLAEGMRLLAAQAARLGQPDPTNPPDHRGDLVTTTPPEQPAAAPRDRLMTPGEVAALFRVDPKTVTRWDKAGKFGDGVIRTPGGHRRFRESRVRELLARAQEQS